LAPHGLSVLLMAGLILILREVFFVITSNKTSQYEERMFYPFAVCTELTVVLMFLGPGVIPLKRELAEAYRRGSNVSLSPSDPPPAD